MCVGSPTAGAWSSFQRRPDDEFETDRAQLVVFSDQTILVGNLKFVEKTDEQLLAAAEMQGHQQRRGQCMVRAHDAREVVDPPIHREFANTGVPKSERERDGVVGLVARRQVAVE